MFIRYYKLEIDCSHKLASSRRVHIVAYVTTSKQLEIFLLLAYFSRFVFPHGILGRLYCLPLALPDFSAQASYQQVAHPPEDEKNNNFLFTSLHVQFIKMLVWMQPMCIDSNTGKTGRAYNAHPF